MGPRERVVVSEAFLGHPKAFLRRRTGRVHIGAVCLLLRLGRRDTVAPEHTAVAPAYAGADAAAATADGFDHLGLSIGYVGRRPRHFRGAGEAQHEFVAGAGAARVHARSGAARGAWLLRARVEIPAAFSESMTETAYGECKNLAAFALSNKFSRKMLLREIQTCRVVPATAGRWTCSGRPS